MEYLNKIEKLKSDKQRLDKAIKRLRNEKPQKVDDLFHELHIEAFEEIDCLKCANCCKTTSPLFRDVDIQRLAKHLKLKEVQFIDTYLTVDEDGDYVFKSSPCPFLLDDNYCSVYEARPNACKEYPHTDRKKVQQILKLTTKNSEICPAVAQIFERIISHYKI